MNFAKKYTNITTNEPDVILINNNTWVKNHTDNFDITVGSFDSSQIANLLGIYIYIKYYKQNFKLSLYRLI